MTIAQVVFVDEYFDESLAMVPRCGLSYHMELWNLRGLVVSTSRMDVELTNLPVDVELMARTSAMLNLRRLLDV